MTVAKTYVCKNEHNPQTITDALTYTPKCPICGEYMVEGSDE